METVDIYNKETAINLHRKMWWSIYDKIIKDPPKKLVVDDLKKYAIKKLRTDFEFDENELKSNCFLCAYAYSEIILLGVIDSYRCDHCPLKHKNEFEIDCLDGLYGLFAAYCKRNKYSNAAKIAKQIAELPEI